jgi:valyl-tRNA synthetase
MQKDVMVALAQLDPNKFEILAALPPKSEDQVAIAIGALEIYLPLAGLVDSGEEFARLQKAFAEAQAQVERLEKLLASSFADRAPVEIVQRERDKLSTYQETVEKIRKQLDDIN